jgi:hypothetical protein
MQEHEKSLVALLLLGAVIGLGKLLVGDEHLSMRLIVGRTLLGSAASLVAGIALLEVPDISPLALLGLGSALGIVGAQYLELFIKRRAGKIASGGK